MRMVRPGHIRRHDGELPRHAEVNDEPGAFEIDQDPLAAPRDLAHRPADDLTFTARGPAPPQALLADLQSGDRLAMERPAQIANDGLDFRQFRHACSPMWINPPRKTPSPMRQRGRGGRFCRLIQYATDSASPSLALHFAP